MNGLWRVAILPDSAGPPREFPTRILVPFPLESALSGVAEVVTPADRVWYRRTFPTPVAASGIPRDPGTVRWLLHFGAVDWETEVFVNGQNLGVHRGGYDPFTFDVTEVLREGQDQELVVAVRDPTDEGNQPRGKQVLDPHGIWYTAVTGIWQTVWLEPVPETYVEGMRIVPDLPGARVLVTVSVRGETPDAAVSVSVLEEGSEVSSATGRPEEPIALPVPDPRPWSPADPFLYDLRVSVSRNPGSEGAGGADPAGGGPVPAGDEVSSYFGMRSISVGSDVSGHPRLLLNGEPLFQLGLLDQGWWPDGLYTAPTDEALRSDIARSRELGFNMIRKHVKVEPARWYYHADREGILVWQDMPSADNETPGAQREFADELRRVVDALGNHPSIVMWVPFNEGWGQHATEAATGWLKAHDPTRLVNGASGWTDGGGGDVLDVHRYPGPGAPDPERLRRWAPPPRDYPEGRPSFPEVRAPVLGEFGGLGLPLPGHTWVEEENWGYRSYENLGSLNGAYQDLLFQLRPLQGEGLAAAVYTQTTDVEVEVNGVMSYDREVVKLDAASVEANRALYRPPPLLREVLPTSRERAQQWRITEEDPGEDWWESGYDDSGWRRAPGGFGTDETP
ncbi:MAG: glycoside hydrolase family 2 protein, partial [Longimicrobiales bacterium]